MPKTYTPPQPFSTGPRPPIALSPVPRESNQVKDHGYCASTQTLALRFTSGAGAIYHYPNFAPEQYEAFLAAESHGKFFGQHIKHLPFTKYPAEPDDEQPDVVSDLLALVGIEAPADVVSAWSPAERRAAADWAGATHLAASDNGNKVPARPAFLPEPWTGPMQGEGIWASNPTPVSAKAEA